MSTIKATPGHKRNIPDVSVQDRDRWNWDRVDEIRDWYTRVWIKRQYRLWEVTGERCMNNIHFLLWYCNELRSRITKEA